jgi:hypothetical protein
LIPNGALANLIALQERDESKLHGLMTQIGQVEQWLAGVCALNGTAYALVVEVVKNGSEGEVIQMW